MKEPMKEVNHNRRAKAAEICAHALGVGVLIMLVLAEPTAVTLSLAVALAPFTLATVLRLTVFLACGVLSLVLGDCRDRAELVACAIGAVQPPGEGEQYRETMIAEIRYEPADEKIPAITVDLLINAPRTIWGAWRRVLRPQGKRARRTQG